MSKPTMGRGLGSLMADSKPQSESQTTNGKPEIAAGVRTLMQGAAPKDAPTTVNSAAPRFMPTSAPKTSPPQVTHQKGPAIPRSYFLLVDALLIALAIYLAYTSPKPMPTSRMIAAIVVVVFAAGCGLCALMAGTEKE
ncbi:MAG: hypothetical protein JWO95_176 [Verrucomicrobiales bacterium]|nr:hypothetical protein [Verrucomicrobiales bacterium]